MLTIETHECPECGRPIYRENFVRTVAEDRINVLFCCEECNHGWDIEEWPLDGDVFVLDYRARTEPDCYERFLARLAEARVA